MLDANLIHDEGNHTFTGGIGAATRLCDLLGVTLKVDPQRLPTVADGAWKYTDHHQPLIIGRCAHRA